MLTQKAVKTKSSTIIENAEKIMDKKTKRTYKKMFKQTNRRKQRLLEKREAQRMVSEYENENGRTKLMPITDNPQENQLIGQQQTGRVKHLEHQLAILGFDNAMRAFDLVIAEMNAKKGFKRHDGHHYYYHLVDVAQILLNFGIRDEDIITAALLHDFIEDVEGASYDSVRGQFNSRVADIVFILTKKKDIDYHTDINEKLRYLNAIANRYETALIKTADRIHNFSSMRKSSRKHRMRQVSETRDFYIPFFKECRGRYVRYSNFFFFAKTTIEPILFEIEQGLNKIQELEQEIERLKALCGEASS